LSFYSCKGDKFKFDATRNIPVNGYVNISLWFQNTFLKMYGYKKCFFQAKESIALEGEPTDLTEDKFKNELKQNGADPIEGIYESTTNTAQMSKYKIGVKKIDGGYNIVYFSGATNYLDWKEGEIKAKLFSTATATLFKAEWKMLNKKPNIDAYVSFEFI